MRKLRSIEKIPTEADKAEGRETLTPRRVFIEVGTSGIPAPYQGETTFKENDVYFGIDIDERVLREAKEKIERGQNINFIQADASELPIKDSSVNELYFGNVFGDPRITEKQKRSFLKEAERVLEADGRLAIKENNTPFSFDKLKAFLQDYNFELEKLVTPEDKNWDEEIRKYHKTAVGTEPWWRVYLVYLKKRKEQEQAA